jgi:cytochrome c oxidase subunit 4
VNARVRHLLLAWVLLLLLLATEFGASFVSFGRTARPVLLFPALLMVLVTVVAFMQVGRSPSIVRGFAVAGLFWLMVLLGLGSIDPLTRTDHRVQPSQGE